ncbi:MAG TPA: SDR family oxidoreductase [Thermomicrobiales bacterium]|nr:SDR family oxidoreductase [Thermomicrobiales bacterium]
MNAAAPSPAGADAFEPDWLARLEPATLFSLAGKVAVVTGAAGGIGRWLAAGLAAAGASVLLTDRDDAKLRVVAAALTNRRLDVAASVVDLDREDAAGAIVAAAGERFGRIDILINNAGVNRRLPMLEVSSALLRHIWEIDFIRCYELAQAAARRMAEQGDGGAILHISSLNAAMGLEDVSLLGPTKAALSQLAKGMAIELAPYGIRTNAIAPGFMATPMNATHWDDPTRAPWIMGRTPLCRPGHPAELVGACLLLVSDAGSFITGQTLYVDGGFTAGSAWNVAPDAGLETFRQRGGYCRPASTSEAKTAEVKERGAS